MSSKAHHHWYEMTQGPDHGVVGRVTRYYVVNCRCGVSSSHQAVSVSDEKLRKMFIRKGWDIGRTPTAHMCPGCKNKKHNRPKPFMTPPQQPAVTSPSPPLPTMTLYAAWQAASQEERKEFIRVLGAAYETVVEINGHTPDDVGHAVQFEPEPEPDDGPDEPADWWQELQRKQEQR